MIEKIESKIKKIDSILEDNTYFDNYLKEIEKRDIKVPVDLNEKLKNSLAKEEKHINKVRYYDILRIAACTILALLLWQITLPSVTSYATVDLEKTRGEEIYTKIDETMEKVSEFFNSPVNLERREK